MLIASFLALASAASLHSSPVRQHSIRDLRAITRVEQGYRFIEGSFRVDLSPDGAYSGPKFFVTQSDAFSINGTWLEKTAWTSDPGRNGRVRFSIMLNGAWDERGYLMVMYKGPFGDNSTVNEEWTVVADEYPSNAPFYEEEKPGGTIVPITERPMMFASRFPHNFSYTGIIGLEEPVPKDTDGEPVWGYGPPTLWAKLNASQPTFGGWDKQEDAIFEAFDDPYLTFTAPSLTGSGMLFVQLMADTKTVEEGLRKQEVSGVFRIFNAL